MKPIIQLQEFHDGTWSVMARIYNPQKAFYEHPDYIDLTREEAAKYCEEVIKQDLSVEEIVETWLLIGT